MGNYGSNSEVFDASCGLFATIDDVDKSILADELHIKTLTLYKNADDLLSTSITPATPALTATRDLTLLSCSYIPNANIASNVANWAIFRIQRFHNGVPAAIPVIAQRATSTAPDGGAASAFVPYNITFFPTDGRVIIAGDVLVFDIIKNVNGQIVPAGVWEIKYRYI